MAKTDFTEISGLKDNIDLALDKKNFEELFKLHSDGKINPEVSDSFSLDDGAQAIAHLKDRKAKGKVIIKI